MTNVYYFINPTEFDLSRYQIFSTLEEAVHPNNQHHSLKHALDTLGLHNTSLDYIINGKNFYDQLYLFPQRYLTFIARKIQRNIRLTYYNKDYGNRCEIYYPSSRPYNETIFLSRFMNHYMINDKLAAMTTFYFIKHLVLKNRLNLVKIPNVSQPRPILLNIRDIIGEQKEFFYKKTVKRIFTTISYADTESLVHGRHLPFLVGKYYNGKFKSFKAGPNQKNKFLDVVESIISEEDVWSGLKAFLESYPNGHNLVYFHNLQYDWFNIKKAPFIYIRSVMKKDGIYYSITFSYYKRIFELRDSYKHIPKPLSDFPATFGLGIAKHEYIIYKLYTLLNITKESVSYRPCLLEDKPEEVLNASKGMKIVMSYTSNQHSNYILVDERIAVSKDFLILCKRFISPNTGRLTEGEYYHIRHYKYYLKLDCKILANGMTVYKKRMKSILGVSCHDKYTLPSTVHYSLCESDCYKGIYEVSESLRTFIGRSVHGGRVLTMHNKMWDIKAKSYVLDARSLYPSAIDRICKSIESGGEIGGFPTGPAECITDWNLRNTYVHYVARISITAITKKQQLSFVTYRTKYRREYTSEMTELAGGQDSLSDLVVDKITLEDWIKFQGVEYTFIEAIGWKNGTNSKYGDCVKSWYNMRRECIEKGNISMSELWKLCLNSSYGKTISKPVNTKIVIKPLSKASEYEAKNAHNLCDKEECSNSVIYSVMTDDFNHSNMSHVGGMILSMSRRIMNEVIDVCNNTEVPAIYTDTDSIHIVDSLYDTPLLKRKRGESVESGLKTLQKAYALKYNKQLLGTALGQFSLELKFPGHTNIRSERCIFLGKKIYIHEVYGENAEGITESYGLIRAKGISKGAFEEHVKKEADKLTLYQRMYNGETVAFNLAYDKPKFKYNKEGVNTTNESIRKISYQGEKCSIGI